MLGAATDRDGNPVTLERYVDTGEESYAVVRYDKDTGDPTVLFDFGLEGGLDGSVQPVIYNSRYDLQSDFTAGTLHVVGRLATHPETKMWVWDDPLQAPTRFDLGEVGSFLDYVFVDGSYGPPPWAVYVVEDVPTLSDPVLPCQSDTCSREISRYDGPRLSDLILADPLEGCTRMESVSENGTIGIVQCPF